MQLRVAQDIGSLQQFLAHPTLRGKTVALVPTMGALHAGHMALVKEAGKLAEVVVASIFVNPSQFGPGEDFSKYPRMMELDLQKLDEAGCLIAYVPSVTDMYPEGFATSITVGPLSRVLEGASRPGHFDGVATVVIKLLLRALPHVAVFGEKDYQQLCVIRRAIKDLDIQIDIRGIPTVREADGLAMSSRNAYLSESERKFAPALYRVLTEAARRIQGGEAVTPVLEDGKKTLAGAGFIPDYLAYADAQNLTPLMQYTPGARLLVAARLGATRLIDNVAVD